MSTRSHIIVRESDKSPISEWSYIYHHCDGYPEGVGSEIGDAFDEKIRSNILGNKYTLDDVHSMITGIDDYYYPDDSIHGDEEYIYVVTLEPDREGVVVDCYSTLPFSFDTHAEKFTMDAGYEFVYEKVYRNTEPYMMDQKQEKEYLEKYKTELHGLANITLLDMLKAICDELTLRETE
jgi:hypothetical protein